MTFEIIKTLGQSKSNRTQREAFLVRTTPLVCRASKTLDLYEVDHVIVEALRVVEDGVVYEETHVVASDEHGAAHDAVLYLGTKALTVPEAMFAVGLSIARPLNGPEPMGDWQPADEELTEEENGA